MPESEQNKQSNFMIEKIKERPVNKKKLIRRTITTAAMAVIFGLIACFTFLVLEPVISNWLYPEEEPQIVVFPEDQEEMSPEEMLSDNMQQEQQAGKAEEAGQAVGLNDEQIENLLSEITLNKENYKQLYSVLSDYVKELNQSMVTITAVSSDLDWFNNVQESSNQVSGLIIANNGKEILILTEYKPLKKAENLTLTFYNGTEAEAQLKGKDTATNMAVISVDINTLSKEFVEKEVKIASLGSSGLSSLLGTPAVALGSPMGSNGSIGYGMICYMSGQQTGEDTLYKLLQTDIPCSQNGGGFLFNMQGQVIGIITPGKSGTDMKNMVTVYGITEMKKRIEKMSNGESFACLGITGVDVTKKANEELNVPYGAYVTEVRMNSPAMLAGIRQGDVVTGIKDNEIGSFKEYVNSLLQCKAGETVKITVMRQVQSGYKELTFSVALGEQ